MPAAGRSFYADEAHGHRYWTYISEELPRVVGQFFRVSQEPADTFVAGLSMGGYGALKLALTHPERFAAAACLSGALDLVAFSKQPDRDEVMGRVFDHQVRAERRPVRAARRSDGDPAAAHLVRHRGLADRVVPAVRRGGARPPGVDVTTDFRPGDHVWSLWDAVIQDVIAWLPMRPSLG